MTNKERLEKIKEVHLERIKQNELYTASFIHIDWLIEQAEKAERLEKALKEIHNYSIGGSVDEYMAYGYMAKKALEE